MKKLLLIFGCLGFVMASFGQAFEIGGIPSLDNYIKKSGFNMELKKATSPDTFMVVKNNEAAYATSSDLGVSPFDFFTSDTVDYYVPGAVNSLAFSTTTSTANYVKAWPFYVSKEFIFDGWAVEVTTGVASTGAAVMGIYTDSLIYPKTLIYSTGAIDCTAGATIVKNALPSPYIHLYPDRLYWLAYCPNSATIAVRAVAAGGIGNFLGFRTGQTTASAASYSVALTYDGTLPLTFAAGGAKSYGIAMACLFLRQK